MHREFRVRQVLHQLPRATGVVEVYVREDDPVDVFRLEVGGFDGREEMRQRMRCAAVDEGAAAVFDDEVGGVERRTAEGGVDGVDAVHCASIRQCRSR